MSKKTKLDITKYVAKTVVGVSTSFTVANIIRQNIVVTKPSHKVQVYVASVAVGMVVAKQTEDYTEKFIDQIADGVKKIQEDMPKKDQ